MKDPLIQALRSPETMTALPSGAWTAIMQRARPVALIGKLGERARAAGVLERLPAAVQRQFASMAQLSAYNDEHLKAETFFVLRALADHDFPVVFLKGAGYALAGLDVARGRISSDIDILVRRADLDATEQGLIAVGWRAMKLDDYDQQYYRRWMHEIPPLRHQHRATVIDVHHTILPLTSRITPDADALMADARTVEVGGRTAYVLSPEDMVVHAAVHAFQDGDLDSRLRDVLDIDEMVTGFAADTGFFLRLLERSRLHQAERPLYYALHIARQLLGTDVPDDVLTGLRPGPVRRGLMNLLVPVALAPSLPDRVPPLTAFARWLLFIRSHWLRMPPLMLARHLAIKGWRRMTLRFRRN